MILQKLLFPSSKTCTREHMYYNGEGITIFMEDSCVEFSRGAQMRTTTYFNSFSVGKWRKYTVLNNLQLRLMLKGDFHLHIHHARKMNGSIKDRCLLDKHISCAEKEDVLVTIPLEETEGAYYFRLNALSDGAKFFGGAYETDVDVSTLPDVKIGIGICTFRREKFVAHNLGIFRSEILENPESPMYGKLEVFISDNSKTLSSELETDLIHIFPNRNLGGSGGFARAMIEIHKVHQERGITHIMMMDDDIRLNPDSLLRTYTMLRLLKPEHRDAFIGGHMLKIDQPHIQSEAADHWNLVAHRPVKYNYELENFNFILKNEIEDKINYFGWWYCCMPIGVVSDTNLPLPIFIKRDDIEYGLRNGKKFITLNGICVWHEAFEYKYSTYLEYYYFRNMCIMNSAHRRSFTCDVLINALKERVREFVLTYRYRDAELSMLGIQHYLNGIDWLMAQDGEKLNMALMPLGYKKQPIEEIDTVFVHGAYEGNLKPEAWGRKMRLICKLTLNGHLLPARGTVVVPAYKPNSQLFFRAKRVINYEEATGTAFVTTRDQQSIRYILKMYRETVKMIKEKYERVTEEYRARYDELININFWNEYLFTSGEMPQIKSGLDVPNKPRNTRYQYYVALTCLAIRLMQILLFWLPVKKNRVMFYVHERKGMTCNPKYILKKLQETFGDKLELIWVSGYPETCQEIKDLGIRVVQANTKHHILAYLRTRFYISNDNFAIWAVRRPGQKWMNTWHAAMNYKHIGYDYLAPVSQLGMHIFKMKNRQPNFYLSGSRFFTEDTAKSFRLDEKIFIPTGLPRNDVMFTNQESMKAKICEHYNIPSHKKLVIYAPTFRRGEKSSTYGMDFKQVCQALTNRFGGDWVVLFRNHSFIKGKSAFPNAVDVSAYHDMQELMCAADMLISDYSSCLYDFALSGRPTLVYATDLDHYIHGDRSLAFPIERWPYPLAQSNKELLKVITEFDQEAYDAAIKQHMADIGSYDNGTAADQVADIVKKYCL